MKKTVAALAIIFLSALSIWLLYEQKKESGKGKERPYVINSVMKIESGAFENNGKIPEQYSCYGEARAIPLRLSGAPSEAKSLAIIVDDPDAPGGNFNHWLIWNIDPKTSALSTGNPPVGSTEGLSSLGKPGFVAPCPPAGIHHYNFKLYALDTMLNLPDSTEKNNLERAMEGHILESAALIGLYGRQA